jgi:PAS domain S-box-containing protein
MLAWRLDGSIELWNAGAERLYGFGSNEAVGHSSHALLQTKFPVQFTELRSKLRSERYWSGELRQICKDGREVIVDSRMQLLSDDTVLEVNRDVTEIHVLMLQQAKLVQDLSAAAAKFEAIFNQSGSFAGIMDLQGYLREANKLSLTCSFSRCISCSLSGESPGDLKSSAWPAGNHHVSMHKSTHYRSARAQWPVCAQ